MMNIIRLAFCLLILLAVSSCATMNKSECLEADWQVIGLEDGAAGRGLAYIGTHRKACAEHGVTPNLEQYNIGREAGLKQFCTYKNGYRQGSRGSSSSDVCQGALQGPYSDGFNRGRVIYDMGKEIDQMVKHLESKKAELAGINIEIQRVESHLISKAGSRADRKHHLDEYNHLQADREALEHYLHDLELDIARKQDERNALNAEYSR
ncbi:MAG: DUF2799 domain-containing protein [Nitrospinae bacterium]|nr:DUF2799 domain-containing protein [Nitrospinota bacterium]